MKTWNYRIIDHGDWLGLHEVHYDEAGTPVSLTGDPCTFAADKAEGTADLIGALEMALRDARTRPVLVLVGDQLVERPVGSGAGS